MTESAVRFASTEALCAVADRFAQGGCCGKDSKVRLDDIAVLGLREIPATFESSLGTIRPLAGWSELCVWVHESIAGVFPQGQRSADGTARDPGETVAEAIFRTVGPRYPGQLSIGDIGSAFFMRGGRYHIVSVFADDLDVDPGDKTIVAQYSCSLPSGAVWFSTTAIPDAMIKHQVSFPAAIVAAWNRKRGPAWRWPIPAMLIGADAAGTLDFGRIAVLGFDVATRQWMPWPDDDNMALRFIKESLYPLPVVG